MKRIPNWEAALAAWQQASLTRTFEWGVFDCALASCEAIAAMTGVDPAAPFRGTYSTEKAALKILHGESLEAFARAIAYQHGMLEVLPMFARRGDLVFVDNDNPMGALGIVDLSGRFACCVLERGLVRMPMFDQSRERWRRAWRV
jgi:hypothetical protein